MFNKSLQPYLQNKVIQKRSWLRTTSKVEAMPFAEDARGDDVVSFLSSFPVPFTELFSWLSGRLAFVLLNAPLLGRSGLQSAPRGSVEVSTFLLA